MRASKWPTYSKKMLQVIKDGEPSASWKPQHLVLFYASSINLLLQKLRINVSTTVSSVLADEFISLFLSPNPSHLLSHVKHHMEDHLWRSQTNPREEDSFACALNLLLMIYSKVRLLPKQFCFDGSWLSTDSITWTVLFSVLYEAEW